MERAAADDPLSRLRLIEARIRAGGRDPRRDPLAGDVVRSHGTGVETHRPAPGGGHYARSRDVTREVRDTWPRRLSAYYMICRPMFRSVAATLGTTPANPDDMDWTLRPGGQVLKVERWQSGLGGGTEEWRMLARPGNEGPWLDILCLTEPETSHDPSIAVEVVEYGWIGCPGRGGRTERATLVAWRRWAKRATVERVS